VPATASADAYVSDASNVDTAKTSITLDVTIASGGSPSNLLAPLPPLLMLLQNRRRNLACPESLPHPTATVKQTPKTMDLFSDNECWSDRWHYRPLLSIFGR